MTFVSHWTAIATALGLDIQSPVELTLPDGRVIKAPVLLRNFGWQNGMVLFEGIPSDLYEVGDTLVAMGYGVSCLRHHGDDDKVDLDAAKEILADWTWSGPPDQRPAWLADPPPDDPAL
jgi:hypothetical protein